MSDCPPNAPAGNEGESSLQELCYALERSFSLDDYLQLRRRFPDEDTALWMFLATDGKSEDYGFDYAFQLQAEMEKWGIPIKSYLGVLDGDFELIDKHCLCILEALAKREKLNSHAVGAGLAIGDALVNFLCVAVLEAIAYYSLPVPDSYQILLKYRLKLFDNEIRDERLMKHRRVIIAKLIAETPGASIRSIARMTGLNPSTISRWMADEDFMRWVRMWRAPPLSKEFVEAFKASRKKADDGS
jgi:hypothetical protein